jgi:spore maturation protein CgeB
MLERNLAALAQRNRSLVERICLPCGDAHVRKNPQGQVLLHYRQSDQRLDLPADVVTHALANCDNQHPIFIFGIGLGELLQAALGRFPSAELTAWERDPWLLRLALSRYDFTDALASGRVRLALAGDLMDLIESAGGSTLVVHPLLNEIYFNERRLLQEAPGPKRALVCEGGLFVDDLVEAMRAEGFTVFMLDSAVLSIEEMAILVQQFQPRFLASINYRDGLAEFCHSKHLPLLCWEIDPALNAPAFCSTPTGHAFIFSYRQDNLSDFRRAGFTLVEYLPLAANPDKRVPLKLSNEECARFSAPLSFVGSSMMSQATKNRERFLSQYQAFRANAADAHAEGERILEELLAEQRRDFFRFVLPASVNKPLAEFARFRIASGFPEDLVLLLGEIAAAERRLALIAQLGHFGIHVWGDEGWRAAEGKGVRYRGSASHHYDLNRIYNASLINLDVGRLYQTDIITMRVFDVLACGGFILAEWSDALDKLFTIGTDIEAYSTLEELESKIAFYLEHPDAARAIAARGAALVREKHSIPARVRHMLRIMRIRES